MDQNGLRLALLRQTLPPLAATWNLYTTHGCLVATSARPSGLFKGSQSSPFSGGPRLSRPHWMSSRFLLSPMPEDQPLPSHLYKCAGSGESLPRAGWIARTEEEPVGVVEDVAVAQGGGAGIDTAHGVSRDGQRPGRRFWARRSGYRHDIKPLEPTSRRMGLRQRAGLC